MKSKEAKLSQKVFAEKTKRNIIILINNQADLFILIEIQSCQRTIQLFFMLANQRLDSFSTTSRQLFNLQTVTIRKKLQDLNSQARLNKHLIHKLKHQLSYYNFERIQNSQSQTIQTNKQLEILKHQKDYLIQIIKQQEIQRRKCHKTTAEQLWAQMTQSLTNQIRQSKQRIASKLISIQQQQASLYQLDMDLRKQTNLYQIQPISATNNKKIKDGLQQEIRRLQIVLKEKTAILNHRKKAILLAEQQISKQIERISK